MAADRDRELKWQIMINTLVGLVLGMIIGLLIIILFNSLSEMAQHPADLIFHVGGAGIFGAVVCGSTAVYGIETWGLLKATLTHYLITIVLYVTANAVLGWFGLGRAFILSLVIFTAGYALIWAIEYFRYKREISDMNRTLQRKQKAGVFGGLKQALNRKLGDDELFGTSGGIMEVEEALVIRGIVLADPFPHGPEYAGVYDECTARGMTVYELSDGNIAVAEAGIGKLATGDFVEVRRVRGYYGYQITARVMF